MIKELKQIVDLLERYPEVTDNYPFKKSLDEMIFDIEKWLDTDVAMLKDIDRIANDIREDNTIVILEETGELNIDYVEEDIENFIIALEQVTGKEYTIKEKVGKRVIVEY